MVTDVVACETRLRESRRGIYNAPVDLEIHQLGGGLALASFGPVIIVVITTAPTDTAFVDELARLTELALVRWPMCAIWAVVHHGAPVPDSEVRRHAGRVLRPFRSRQCVVYSMLGLGFWAGTAIATTTVLAKLMGQRPLIETSVEAGADRIGIELIGVDAEKLAVIHDELLESLQAHESAGAPGTRR
jgi:hypothetical protein